MLFYDRNTIVIFQNVHDGFKELSLLIAQCELFFKFFDSLFGRRRCRGFVHGAGSLSSNGGALAPILPAMLA